MEVANFLTTHKIIYREKNSDFHARYCPLCPKPHNEDFSNMYTMGIKSTTGVYHCFRCGAGGNWFNFKDQVLQRFYGKSLNQMVGDNFGIGTGATLGFGEGESRMEAINAKFDGKIAFNYFL